MPFVSKPILRSDRRARRARPRVRLYGETVILIGLALAGLFPQLLNGQATDAILTGVVLNAATNQPLTRALVRLGSHAILTEHDGKFQFSGVAGATANLEVTKPGFYDGPDATSAGKSVSFSATPGEPLKVYLFPEALITGTVTAPTGDPLSGIFVQVLKKSGLEDGGANWLVAGQTNTNGDGEFRLPVPSGDYIVETQFVANQFALQKAVLPLLAPEAGPSLETGRQPMLHVTAGSEQHLDLRPLVRSTREVHVRVEGGASGPSQPFQQIEAHLANGLSFYPTSRPSGSPGEMITTLPSGHFDLTVAALDGEGGNYGETSIDVPDSSGDKETPGVVFHLAKVVPLAVELTVDPASSNSTSDNQPSVPPNAQQLGLHFVHSGQAGTRRGQDGYLQSTRNGSPSLTLLPGRYKLTAQPLDHWYIESANVGGTDLMTQELDLEPGGTSTPLRITMSNRTASLKGTVKVDGEPGARCWIYLLATSTTVTPVILSISGVDGTFSKPSIPPGSYRAVAFESRYTSDLSDAGKLERLAPYMKSFSVAAGETANLDLEAVPTQELMN